MRLAACRLICRLLDHNWMICDCYISHHNKATTSPFICSRCRTRDGDN